MGRIILYVVTVAMIGYILTATVAYKKSAVSGVPPQSAAVVKVPDISTSGASNANSGNFNETGTLIFYPNNVRPVPYLFYQDSRGRTVAKALVFSVSPPSGFSSWTGARISVMGRLEQEHVVVSRISYISPP